MKKRQENDPVKERNNKREGKADMKNSKRRLLALNLTERGGAICTKEPLASPRGRQHQSMKLIAIHNNNMSIAQVKES